MNNSLVYIIIFLISVLISSVSQVILKKSAQKKYGNALKEYLNPLVILAYILFFGASLLTTVAYGKVELSLGTVLESTGYIYVAILGHFILHEKMGKQKILGNGIIIAGILIFAFV